MNNLLSNEYVLNPAKKRSGIPRENFKMKKATHLLSISKKALESINKALLTDYTVKG